MSVVELNRKLVLEKPARQADGAGGYEQSWVPVGVLWGILPGRYRNSAFARDQGCFTSNLSLNGTRKDVT